jgi:CRISPR-associated exonuclease Cas4
MWKVGASLEFTGTQVNYFFVCTRKLWFFSHNVEFEADSDLVLLGRLLHEHRYKRKVKEVSIGRIKIDFVEGKGEIHEIKRSRKIENAHIYQLLYYLFYLKRVYNVQARGVLNYPLLRRRVPVELTSAKEAEMEKLLIEIDGIVSKPSAPEPVWRKYCRSCAYRELCWGVI